jgi:hypothetical protein
MQTNPKLDSTPKAAPKPARDRFRKQIRTGVSAGEPGDRLFDSQNQNGGRTSSVDDE